MSTEEMILLPTEKQKAGREPGRAVDSSGTTGCPRPTLENQGTNILGPLLYFAFFVGAVVHRALVKSGGSSCSVLRHFRGRSRLYDRHGNFIAKSRNVFRFEDILVTCPTPKKKTNFVIAGSSEHRAGYDQPFGKQSGVWSNKRELRILLSDSDWIGCSSFRFCDSPGMRGASRVRKPPTTLLPC